MESRVRYPHSAAPFPDLSLTFFKVYDPICGFACQASVPKTLECPDDHHMDDMDEEEHMDMGPSAECLTTHQTYLQSLAWCMHTHCDISVANLPRLEKWWVKYLAGRQIGQPIPNISYQTAVEQVKTPPTVVLEKGEVLNQTVKVDEESYQANHNIYVVFEEMEINHSTTRQASRTRARGIYILTFALQHCGDCNERGHSNLSLPPAPSPIPCNPHL